MPSGLEVRVQSEGGSRSDAWDAAQGESAESVVAGNAVLSAIDCDEVTRIVAVHELAACLPKVLRPAQGECVEYGSDWPEDMLDSEIYDWWDDVLGGIPVPVLHVNEERWAWWGEPPDGPAALPLDRATGHPAFKELWGKIEFTEQGSMTSGWDCSMIGLLTPALVCSLTIWDEGPTQVRLLHPTGSAAQTMVNWLLEGDFTSQFIGAWGGDHRLFVRLLARAATGADNGRPVSGNELVPEMECLGTYDSSMWTLTLGLPTDQAETAVLEIRARAAGPSPR